MVQTDARVRVVCPGCQTERAVSPRMAGLAVVCRACGRPLRVPTTDRAAGGKAGK